MFGEEFGNRFPFSIYWKVGPFQFRVIEMGRPKVIKACERVQFPPGPFRKIGNAYPILNVIPVESDDRLHPHLFGNFD